MASGSAAIIGWNACFSAMPSWQDEQETAFSFAPWGSSLIFARSAWQSMQESPASPWIEPASAVFGGFLPLSGRFGVAGEAVVVGRRLRGGGICQGEGGEDDEE